MSETTTVEASEGVDAPEAVKEPETVQEEPTTFDADYVKGLRDEAAQRRTEAKSATERGDALYEQLLTRTIEQATDGILYDPTDLPRNGDYETDGVLDIDKVREAAQELATRKPHLSRPNGDVRQGAREHTAPETLLSLARRGL